MTFLTMPYNYKICLEAIFTNDNGTGTPASDISWVVGDSSILQLGPVNGSYAVVTAVAASGGSWVIAYALDNSGENYLCCEFSINVTS